MNSLNVLHLTKSSNCIPKTYAFCCMWVISQFWKYIIIKTITTRDCGSVGLEWEPGICRFKIFTEEAHSQLGSSQPTPSCPVGLRWEPPSHSPFSLQPSPLKEAGGTSLNLGSQITSHFLDVLNKTGPCPFSRGVQGRGPQECRLWGLTAWVQILTPFWLAEEPWASPLPPFLSLYN